MRPTLAASLLLASIVACGGAPTPAPPPPSPDPVAPVAVTAATFIAGHWTGGSVGNGRTIELTLHTDGSFARTITDPDGTTCGISGTWTLGGAAGSETLTYVYQANACNPDFPNATVIERIESAAPKELVLVGDHGGTAMTFTR